MTAIPTITAFKDTWIQDAGATNNYDTDDTLSIGLISGKGVDDRRALIDFDISAYEGPSVNIVSAILTLDGGSAPGGMTVWVRRTSKLWVSSQATWNIYSTGNSWDTGGGDFIAGVAASFIAAANTITVGIANLLRAAIDAGDSNLQIILMQDDTPDTGWSVKSLNHATPSLRPKLDITFKDSPLAPPRLSADRVAGTGVGRDRLSMFK